MTLGIIGTRRRNTEADFQETLTHFKIVTLCNKIDRIVSGGCPQGGDRFAEKLAVEFKIPITIHRAKWSTYGWSAGFIRNGRIAKDADLLLAVVAKDRKGGTEDTIKKYLKLGKTRLLLVGESLKEESKS